MRPIILALLLGISSQLFAQNDIERIKHFNLEKGVAIQGYDPVAYFIKNKAEKGDSNIITKYNGITYYFVHQNNKETFLKDPSKYEPQYGGWCAFAMGDDGKKVKIDPKTFKILGDKLFLFYNANFNNTLKSWNKDENILKAKADRTWSKTIKL